MLTREAALITGASSGIGAMYADRLARRGLDLILVARDRARLDDVATRLQSEHGVTAHVLRADLTDPDDLRRVEDRLRTDSSVRWLINNAGATLPSAVLGTDLDRMDTIIRLNVTAVTHLASVAATAFVARGGGTIVNVSSSVVPAPELYRGIYGGTKAYVMNFSLSLQAEVAEHGVRVQVIVPGTTRTEIFKRAGKDIARFDPAIVMEVEDLVDAALAGLDQGEVVTIPSLPDRAEWEALTAARLRMAPNLSRRHPAERYRATEKPRA
jgi:short-subunit dehydrogenase